MTAVSYASGRGKGEGKRTYLTFDFFSFLFLSFVREGVAVLPFCL